MPLNQSSFESRLQAVEERIERALDRSGRKRSEITLVAVTKKFSVPSIREAYSAGLRDFGENYIQEFSEKEPGLRDLADARFHLIGHLQSNKARVASQLFQVIETADSVKLLQRLDAAAAERHARTETLLEIKLSTEEAKAGARPEDIPILLEAAQKCQSLDLTGLMTMPPWPENPEQSRPYFQQLAKLGRQYGLAKLSMGMSGDLEVAIDEGATIVRVGTALFGPRPKPQSKTSPPVA